MWLEVPTSPILVEVLSIELECSFHQEIFRKERKLGFGCHTSLAPTIQLERNQFLTFYLDCRQQKISLPSEDKRSGFFRRAVVHFPVESVGQSVHLSYSGVIELRDLKEIDSNGRDRLDWICCVVEKYRATSVRERTPQF